MTPEDIKKYRSRNNLTQKDLAEIVSLSISAVRSWEQGQRNVPDNVVTLLKLNEEKVTQSNRANKALSLNEDLVTYNSSPIKGDLKEVLVNYMRVPFVPIKAQAGFPSGYGDDLYMQNFDKVLWEIDDTEYKGNYVVFEVGGDSMDDGSYNSILERDKILCREIGKHLWKYKLHFNKWNFVLVHPDDGIVIKRIVDHDTKTGILKCHSLNPYYEDFDVNINELSALFNVVDIKRNARL